MTNVGTHAPKPEPENRVTKLGLYVRLAFGAVVLFGIVGSIAGYRSGSTMVFILTAVCWTLSKIVVEAIDAYRVLSAPASKPPPKSKPPIDPPPTAPAVA